MTRIKYTDKKLGRHRKGVDHLPKTDDIVIISKYKGNCYECGKTIPAGSWVVYTKSLKVIRHNENCP